MISRDSITYKIFDSVEGIKSIKEFWVSNQWHQWTDFDYYINIVIHEIGVLKPYIIVVFEDQNPIFLLIGNILENDYQFKIGYKSILKIKTNYLEIMYGGILGDQSPAVCRETVYFIKNILTKEKIDYVFFRHLDINSNLYKAIKKFGGILSTGRFDVANPHLYMDIPESYEKFLKTLKLNERKNIKRYARKLESDLIGKIEIKFYQSLEDIDRIMEDVEEIATKTYQSKLGVTMINDRDTRKRIQFELQNSRLLVWVLYIEEKPVSYWTGLLYKKSILGSTMGYLQEYSQYRPGLYLMVKMIAYFCGSDRFCKFDFGFGDADYKREYASTVSIESNAFIYSLTLKGFLFNILGTINRVALLLYRKLAVRFKKVRRIKKKSRDRLINT